VFGERAAINQSGFLTTGLEGWGGACPDLSGAPPFQGISSHSRVPLPLGRGQRPNSLPFSSHLLTTFIFSRVGVGRGCDANVAPFPIPAHRTGREDFPHPALRLVSRCGTRGLLRPTVERAQERPTNNGVDRLSPIT